MYKCKIKLLFLVQTAAEEQECRRERRDASAKKGYSWKLEAKTEGTNGFQNFMSAVYSTNLSERNYTKGFASEESAARTSFHRKTCQHRWYLLFLLPSPNLANLDAGQKSFNGFMSFYVRVFFCRKPVLFPSIESRVPVNALFNGRTFCTKGRSI